MKQKDKIINKTRELEYEIEQRTWSRIFTLTGFVFLFVSAFRYGYGEMIFSGCVLLLGITRWIQLDKDINKLQEELDSL